MATEQLERSILERKERDELHAIAAAMALKPAARLKKADIIDLILRATGVGTESGDGPPPPAAVASTESAAAVDEDGSASAPRPRRFPRARNGSAEPSTNGSTAGNGVGLATETPAVADGQAAGTSWQASPVSNGVASAESAADGEDQEASGAPAGHDERAGARGVRADRVLQSRTADVEVRPR